MVSKSDWVLKVKLASNFSLKWVLVGVNVSNVYPFEHDSVCFDGGW